MRTKYWQEFLIPYQQAIDEIVLKFTRLREQYSKIGEYSPIETVSGRVKSVSSILEKIQNCGVDMDDLEEKIHDIAGIRITCQFEEDIYEIIDHIEKRMNCDMEIVKIKDYLTEKKPSGYKSYHLIIRYPVYTVFGFKKVLVEIQIRTLAMNFWSIIDHSLNYKYKENIPEEIKSRLVNAANAVHEIDREMSSIRGEIQSAQRLFGLKSSSVSGILESIGQLYKLNRADKASEYELIFNELFEQEDILKLILLQKELNSEVTRIESKI